jgi:hypothetical protein
MKPAITSSPLAEGRRGGPIALAMGKMRGFPVHWTNDSIRLPLTSPMASPWAPFLSPLARGEDEEDVS